MSARGTFRRGFFTSPAVNVTLNHASLEKSEPTMATAIAGSIIAPATSRTDTTAPPECATHRAVQKPFRFAANTSLPRPVAIPAAMSPARASTLAAVNESCTSFPARIPLAFMNVRIAIEDIATACWPPTLNGPRANMSADIAGARTALNLAKAMATAAMVPVWITRKRVHPYRKPSIGPYASRRNTYWPPARGMSPASSP